VTDQRLIPAGPPERGEPYAGVPGERDYDDGFDHLEQPAACTMGDRDVVCFERTPHSAMFAVGVA
jgi:hypothetical protein